MNNETNKTDLSTLANSWPSAFVARHKVGEFTGGIVTPGYLANMDNCTVDGVPGRFRCGRKIIYPVAELIQWLEKRCEVI